MKASEPDSTSDAWGGCETEQLGETLNINGGSAERGGQTMWRYRYWGNGIKDELGEPVRTKLISCSPAADFTYLWGKKKIEVGSLGLKVQSPHSEWNFLCVHNKTLTIYSLRSTWCMLAQRKHCGRTKTEQGFEKNYNIIESGYLQMFNTIQWNLERRKSKAKQRSREATANFSKGSKSALKCRSTVNNSQSARLQWNEIFVASKFPHLCCFWTCSSVRHQLERLASKETLKNVSALTTQTINRPLFPTLGTSLSVRFLLDPTAGAFTRVKKEAAKKKTLEYSPFAIEGVTSSSYSVWLVLV